MRFQGKPIFPKVRIPDFSAAVRGVNWSAEFIPQQPTVVNDLTQ